MTIMTNRETYERIAESMNLTLEDFLKQERVCTYKSWGFNGDIIYPDFNKIPQSIYNKLVGIYQNIEKVVANGTFILLKGPVGCGKTMSAVILCDAIYSKMNIIPVVASATEILEFGNNDYKNCPVLVIDDLGATTYSQKVDDIFIDLLIYRENQNLTTIVTTNSKNENIFKNERLVDRLTRRYVLSATEGSQRVEEEI